MELSQTANASPGSPFTSLFSMFYEPSRAFQMLSPARRTWIPLLLVMGSSLALMLWYFNAVDFAWLQEQLAESLPAPEREAAKQFMTKGIFMGGTLFGIVTALPFMLGVSGLYLMLISKTMGKQLSFNDGFSLSAWACIPMVLTLPLGAMQILMASNGQLSFSELNPVSLNQLLFHYGIGNPMAGVLDSLSVFTLWNVFLLVVGYERWASVSRATALKVVLVPYATIYGVWLAFAMSKAA